MEQPYAIEMLNITKRFPGIVANDNITLQLKRGEIHALLGENGAGKSTLMSVLFGLYQPEEGVIKKDGQVVQIKDPNDANALGIGMVHQHFKLVECFSILDNIILGVEPCKNGFLQKQEAREKVLALSEKYGLQVDPDALVEDVTVGMQQRTEIGVDVDQSANIDTYGEGMCVTSAMKGLAETVKHMLGEVVAGNFANYGGQVETLGLVNGDDPTANYVQLPMETTQWGDGFTQDDYKALVKAMYDGDVTVSNDISAMPATTITVNFAGNIK